MSRGKSLLLGFIVGGAVSAAATLLTTPSSGRELRTRVKEQSVEWKHMIDDIIEEGWKLKDQIAKTSKEGAALISEVTDEIKTSIEEWKIAVEPHQESIHDYLEQIESSIKDLEQKIQEQNNKKEKKSQKE